MEVKIIGINGLVNTHAAEIARMIDLGLAVEATPKQWRRINRHLTVVPATPTIQELMEEARTLCHEAQIVALEWGIEI